MKLLLLLLKIQQLLIVIIIFIFPGMLLSSNRDNNNGYKIHLSDYIVQNKLNYYNLVYDSEKGSGINKYKFENGTNILILENKIYYVYIVAYNSAGQSNKVFTPFRYGKFPYNLKLNDLSKTNNFSKIQFKNNLSGNILLKIIYQEIFFQ